MLAVSVHELGPVLRRVLRAPAVLYRVNAGWLLGGRFLLLTHVGRHSGKRYGTVLEVIGNGPAAGEVIVIAGLGRAAQWYRNLQVHPTAEVLCGRRRFRAVYRELGEPEAAAVLAEYERRNRWVRPLVHGMLRWLVGWPYDGSQGARERLVRELPVLVLCLSFEWCFVGGRCGHVGPW